MMTEAPLGMKQRFMITGANGFVGSALSQRLRREGQDVIELRRTVSNSCSDVVSGLAVTYAEFGLPESGRLHFVKVHDDFVGMAESWAPACQCDCVVHLAARVHVMKESSADALARYRETNVAGTLRVAETAVRARAKRFIFMSSVKALGDSEPDQPSRPWRETDIPAPHDPYGRSKAEAEVALRAFCDSHGMECVIIRPPLVYGPGVKANFRQMMAAVARGIPLPLARVKARRSMVFVDNLVDAILLCASHPAAAGECFHVSDGDDLSVAEMVDILGDGIGRRARLIGLPPSLLAGLARIAGKAEQADRLLRPLRLDIRHVKRTLDWFPPVEAREGLNRTAVWYRESKRPRVDSLSF